jgi:hypothetical protein
MTDDDRERTVADLATLACDRARKNVQLVTQLLDDDAENAAVLVAVAAEMINGAAFYLTDDDTPREKAMGLVFNAVFRTLGGKVVIKAFKTMEDACDLAPSRFRAGDHRHGRHRRHLGEQQLADRAAMPGRGGDLLPLTSAAADRRAHRHHEGLDHLRAGGVRCHPGGPIGPEIAIGGPAPPCGALIGGRVPLLGCLPAEAFQGRNGPYGYPNTR